jgi:hypothetical protein
MHLEWLGIKKNYPTFNPNIYIQLRSLFVILQTLNLWHKKRLIIILFFLLFAPLKNNLVVSHVRGICITKLALQYSFTTLSTIIGTNIESTIMIRHKAKCNLYWTWKLSTKIKFKRMIKVTHRMIFTRLSLLL